MTNILAWTDGQVKLSVVLLNFHLGILGDEPDENNYFFML